MRRVLISATVAAVAAMLIASYPGFSPAPKTAVAFNKRGMAYQAKAQYDRAIADFDQAIHLDPKFATAFYNRGLAFGSKDEYDRAIADFDQAIRFDPKDVRALYGRALAYGSNAQYDRAIADFDEWIRLNPNDADAFYNRGLAYLGNAEYDRAIADFDETIRLHPSDAARFYNRAVAYLFKAQYDRAIADFDQAIRLDPRDAVIFGGRGIANFNSGRFAAAARDFEQSLSLDAHDAEGVLWLHLARTRSRGDDTRELTSDAARLDLNTWPGPILAFYLGRINTNEMMAAARTGNSSAQRNQSCDAYFFVGEDAVLHQDAPKAAQSLRQARDTCPPRHSNYAAAEAELKRIEK